MAESLVIRIDVDPEAERDWTAEVARMYDRMLMRKVQGWFTGYNSNIDGHEAGKIRHYVYNGGSPKFRARIDSVASNDYEGLVFA